MGQSQVSFCAASHVDDETEHIAVPAEDTSGLPAEVLPRDGEDEEAVEPLPSLLLTKGPVSAASTNLQIKPEAKAAGSGQPAPPEGCSKPPAEVAAGVPHVTYDDSVPSSLRYGPRELRHMQALGLIPKDTQAMGRGPGHAATLPSADVAKEEAERKAQQKKARKAQKQAEKLDESLKVRAFLDKHGFETVKSKKRHLFRTSFPLHTAVRENNADMVTFLLKAGASYRKADSAGRSPLELAQHLNTRAGSHAEVISILQDAPTLVVSRNSTRSASSRGPRSA